MIRVFVPNALWTSMSAYLIGWHNADQQPTDSTVVTCFIWAFQRPETEPNSLITMANGSATNNVGKTTLVGFFENANSAHRTRHVRRNFVRQEQTFFLGIHLTPQCKICISEVILNGRTLSPGRDCHVVTFDPFTFVLAKPEIIDCYQKVPNCASNNDVISVFHSALSDFRISHFRTCDGVVDLTGSTEKSHGFLYDLKRQVFQFATTYVLGGLCAVSGNRSFVPAILSKASLASNVAVHMKNVLTMSRYLKPDEANAESENRQSLRRRNAATAILFDLVLGISLTVILRHVLSATILLDLFLDFTIVIVANLRLLLIWLMGIPAGLKLNDPLNTAMGTFFLYHIYLWEAYLYVVTPLMKLMLDAALYCGMFGFSLQLAVLQDLVAMATFHIYCFYAYAARLYHINFTGLIAYWRLFRGKKWNPLRKRIDSCYYEVDRLFMGTLGFTMLLFLLPTTLMYYIVFTALRIFVLLTQGLIHKSIRFIYMLPLYTVVLRLVGTNTLIGGTSFSVIQPQTSEVPLVLSMKGLHCSWSKALFGFLPEVDEMRNQTTTWKTFTQNLVTGNVIYPI